tara:strand:- start:16899 stop:17114 length:216 start_codon:yes stop_codon:yes gene_type:complete
MGFLAPKAPKPAPPMPAPTPPPTEQIAGLPETRAVAKAKAKQPKGFDQYRIPLIGGVDTNAGSGLNTRTGG